MALDEPKGWIALVVGLLVTALGIIPLLAGWGLIGFNLPDFLLKLIPSIALWFIAGIGVYLLIDSILEDSGMRVISIIVSILILAIGIVELLFQFSVIGFGIPFIGELAYNIIFVVEGLFLIIASFAMQ